MSCNSMRLPTAAARLLQLSSRSPMRSRSMMNFRQASSSRAWLSSDLGDDRGHSLIDDAIEGIELLLALANSVQNRSHAGGNSLGNNTGGDARDPAGLQRLLVQLGADGVGSRESGFG